MSKENSANEETKKNRMDLNDYEILNWMAIDDGARYNPINQRESESIVRDIYRNGTIGGHAL